MTCLARRITQTSPKSYGMSDKAAPLEAQGIDLIRLDVGRPIHDTPSHIKEAAIAALRAGKVHYSEMQGESALRAALASKLTQFNGMAVTPGDILITNGLTHGSFAAIMTLLDAGDEAILLDPHYPQHVGKIEIAGARAVMVPLDAADGFSIRADWIEAAITPRTRVIVLVNPANPTGRPYGLRELEAVAEVAIRHDLAVISDEVYEFVIYEPGRHISIAALPGMAERTVSLFAFTKAYAMDGWRLGYAVAPPAIMQGMIKIATNEVTHVNSFIQYGALEAVSNGQAAMEAMIEDDRRKRDLMVMRLNQMPGVHCPAPDATIYAFPDIRATGKTSQELADLLLFEAHVVVEAGSFYGATGEGHLRLCFGSETYERIDQAMTRISHLLNRI
ncbi:pyridoxal phosphate-dependent aminotransferase [Rhizorhabdus wittichii]|uniref:pyridoxal phosphate-dependent aminotransferase n=1 Tax=Rhizorhabdus wittichii TaxID=160791 RepID=UPI0002D3C063|nr:aminotransferase class I/II-fold pyridoxal phosphate-dependent enzyme [Rhizorhabdus wittichii]